MTLHPHRTPWLLRQLMVAALMLLVLPLLPGCLGAGASSAPQALTVADEPSPGTPSSQTAPQASGAPAASGAAPVQDFLPGDAPQPAFEQQQTLAREGDLLGDSLVDPSPDLIGDDGPLPEPIAGFTDLDTRFRLDNVRQYFVKNEHMGSCIVVEGRVVNVGSEPVDLVEIEAVLLDASGAALTSKRALGGVTLAISQLETFPEADIEALLQDEAGILSSNRNVRQGGTVPFMMVFFNPPEGVAEYAIRVVDAAPAEV